jgi:hypothetical protein
MKAPDKVFSCGKWYSMIGNQIITSCSISYKVRGNKSNIKSTLEGARMMIAGLERDGALDVHIEHYFNGLGRMIK